MGPDVVYGIFGKVCSSHSRGMVNFIEEVPDPLCPALCLMQCNVPSNHITAGINTDSS